MILFINTFLMLHETGYLKKDEILKIVKNRVNINIVNIRNCYITGSSLEHENKFHNPKRLDPFII